MKSTIDIQDGLEWSDDRVQGTDRPQDSYKFRLEYILTGCRGDDVNGGGGGGDATVSETGV